MTLKKFAGNQSGAWEMVLSRKRREEDEAGRGNPVTLGNSYAVCWLAPAGYEEKGDPYFGGYGYMYGPGVKPGVPCISNALEGLIILETPTMK